MKTAYHKISGMKDEKRVPSRIVEEMIQKAIEQGHQRIEVDAFGQHGIGGRIWRAGSGTVHLRIQGHSGQRAGSMGYPGTIIEVMGPASDDIGWLNAGAEITVHGNASNGVMNGGAQGRVYIGGNIGARGMTMTKRNPRFDPPELWVLGAAGDYFGEFMAGGTAVICGYSPILQTESVLGYRPLVGMVGGKVFFRGDAHGFSEKDAVVVPIEDEEWEWLSDNIEIFLGKIDRSDLFDVLSKRSEWKLLRARTTAEKMVKSSLPSMEDFRRDVWDRELGRGGLIGDLQEVERGAVPVITHGEWRRYVPVWEHGKYAAPCQSACPTGIPVQERWHLIRSGQVDKALELGFNYTPLPATVCGSLCPNPCMAACTRHLESMEPVDVRLLGRAGKSVSLPKLPEKSGKRVAVIGGGPGGISAAWHLTLKGHEAVLFDRTGSIGGKIASLIPESRIAKETLDAELSRVEEMVADIRLNQEIDLQAFKKIKKDFDKVVVAVGTGKPRMLPVPGIELALAANDFLEKAKADKIKPGKKVVIIGAGNVGCDVATEAARLGAREITMIDVQKPAAFGKEREDAEAVGATFNWPCFTQEITPGGVVLKDGEIMEADTVVVSIGDVPDLDFLGETITACKGFISVDQFGRTSDPDVFAVGDIVAPGLITDAIGAGKRAAEAIDDLLTGRAPRLYDQREEIDPSRISLAYFDPMVKSFDSLDQCGESCASCGRCRDCGICVTVCPEGAISREELSDQEYQYVADPDKCIGCGFCAGACPCGIWNLVPNEPL